MQPEILMDDVRRAGFVHEIKIESEGGTGHRPVPSGDPPASLWFNFDFVDEAGAPHVVNQDFRLHRRREI